MGPGVRLNLATVLHQRGRLRGAETQYKLALVTAKAAALECPGCIAQATEVAKAEANLAALLLQVGRAQEAKGILEEGVPWQGLPSSVRATGLYHLGLAYNS